MFRASILRPNLVVLVFYLVLLQKGDLRKPPTKSINVEKVVAADKQDLSVCVVYLHKKVPSRPRPAKIRRGATLREENNVHTHPTWYTQPPQILSILCIYLVRKT